MPHLPHLAALSRLRAIHIEDNDTTGITEVVQNIRFDLDYLQFRWAVIVSSRYLTPYINLFGGALSEILAQAPQESGPSGCRRPPLQ